MFILYAVVIGLVLGFVGRGRIENLASVQLHWSGAIMAGLLVQVVLFSDAVTRVVGDMGPALYVASTALVLAAVVRNRAIPGIPIVIAGAACNFAAIAANGGFMPAGQGALAALGKVVPAVYSNSSAVPDPALWPLTDIFALPRWLPAANIFSAGDVLIGIGIALTIALAMRRPAAAPAAESTTPRPRDGAPAH
jgi:hypothetical protein